MRMFGSAAVLTAVAGILVLAFREPTSRVALDDAAHATAAAVLKGVTPVFGGRPP